MRKYLALLSRPMVCAVRAPLYVHGRGWLTPTPSAPSRVSTMMMSYCLNKLSHGARRRHQQQQHHSFSGAAQTGVSVYAQASFCLAGAR